MRQQLQIWRAIVRVAGTGAGGRSRGGGGGMVARSWSSLHLASLILLTLALLPKSIKIYCINTFTFPEQRFLTNPTAGKSISKLEIDG